MLEGRALKEHMLNRLGYGLSEWHSARYDQLGFDQYVEEQLSGTLPAIAPTGAGVKPKLQRSLAARRQLEVVLLDFWFNHFNVDASGGVVERTVGRHQSVIQNHLLGRFADMLLATAKSPAMLDYLDNRFNFEAETVNGREYGLNENYARELMELHTLGVDGGYTEADIIEVARVLTGWSLSKDAYTYKRFRHDGGQKVVMGATFPAGREEDEGVELLNMLAAHPSTASFISRKLCRRFVSENPASVVVDAGAAAFSASDGNLAATAKAIIGSQGFKGTATFRSKVKPPHRYLVSAVLAMGATEQGQYNAILDRLVDGVSLLGEDPYEVAPPTGYPEASGYWVSSSSMLARFQLAGVVASDPALRRRLEAVSGVNGGDPAATVDAVAAHMCPGGISPGTRSAAVGYTSQQSGNAERVSAAAHAILSSPEFVRF